MPNIKKSDVADKSWNILRLALLWARKGGVFKRRLTVGVVPKFLKSLGHTNPRGQLHYGERELSFDKTPVFHVKMHRPASMLFNIPCITQKVDFDYDFHEASQDYEDGVYGYYDERRQSFLKGGAEEDYEYECCEEKFPADEEGIDVRAEEFIAKFHHQMKLQRQISYLQYHETPEKAQIDQCVS